MVCFVNEGKSYPTPILPDFPEERVSEGPPFYNTGVDFAGPLYVEDAHMEGENIKAYVRRFTCASTWAVHSELTSDLSAALFLLVFRRFASRRGLPSTMISDNVKVSKSSSEEIKKVVRAHEVQHYMVNHQVT